MEDEVGGPLISTHFLDVSSHNAPLSCNELLSDLVSSPTSILRTESVTASEANDVLKNGIIVETSKGLEWISLTDALASGVNGLNLSVEDFQNVAAQLLHSQKTALTAVDDVAGSSMESNADEKMASTPPDLDIPVQTYSLVNSGVTLESIAEAAEHCEEIERGEVFQPIELTKKITVSVNSKSFLKKKFKLIRSSDSSSLTVSESTGTNSDSSVQSVPSVQIKKKGGWPKGRKRKPELANRPPKAPCTGYVYYLNEKRVRPEFRSVPFPEITKILGNEWSSLSLENKKEYLERSELDKKRYREELKIYRNSDAYRSYLKRRRIKSCKSNGTEESDIDAADEIDDEDNEELYCRSCDQWFTTLHNKKEHLYGKQHFQAITLTNRSSLSFDESSLDGTSLSSLRPTSKPELPSVPDAMTNVFQHIAEREREIKTLQESMKVLVVRNKNILKELQELKQSQVLLQKLSAHQKEEQQQIEKTTCDLWDVPALFYQQHVS